MSDPLTGITSSLDSLTKELRKLRFAASRSAAEAIKGELLGAFKDAGRSRFMRSAIGIEIRSMSQSDGLVVGRAGRDAGAVAIGDEGTEPHVIRPRTGKGLLLPGGNVRRKVNHPGARGTGMWDKGLGKGDREADAAVAAAADAAMDRGF